MIYQDWQLTLISLVLLPPVAWVMDQIGRSMRKAATRGMEETGDSPSSVRSAGRTAHHQGLRPGRSCAERADTPHTRRLRYLAESGARAIRRRAIDRFYRWRGGGGHISVAGYQSLHGRLALNQFFAFLAAMLLAQQPVRNLSQLRTIATAGLAAANRIFA